MTFTDHLVYGVLITWPDKSVLSSIGSMPAFFRKRGEAQLLKDRLGKTLKRTSVKVVKVKAEYTIL